MADLASEGKFLMVEIDSDDEETEVVVEGDPKVIDLQPRPVEDIKKEVVEKSWKEIPGLLVETTMVEFLDNIVFIQEGLELIFNIILDYFIDST